MKIAACCVTYNCPKLLGRAIECFNRQTYEDRVLLILEDAGQLPALAGDRWVIDSAKPRYPDLGTKRNAAVARAIERWPDIGAYAVWDDDDIYLPHHLEACVAALGDYQWGQARHVLAEGNRQFTRMETFRPDIPNSFAYHGSWCFRREAFELIGGYFPMNNGEDVEIADRALRVFGRSGEVWRADAIPDPTYCYTTTGQHLSAMGPGGYEKFGRQKIEPVTELDISWPEDYSKWPIDDEVLPRNW